MTHTEALRLALEALEMSDICADDCKCTRKRAINGIKAALEAKDEPEHSDELTIAYMSGLHRGKELAQRTWVGLTADEMESLFQLATYMDDTDYIHMLMMAEDKLKEKNT